MVVMSGRNAEGIKKNKRVMKKVLITASTEPTLEAYTTVPNLQKRVDSINEVNNHLPKKELDIVPAIILAAAAQVLKAIMNIIAFKMSITSIKTKHQALKYSNWKAVL